MNIEHFEKVATEFLALKKQQKLANEDFFKHQNIVAIIERNLAILSSRLSHETGDFGHASNAIKTANTAMKIAEEQCQLALEPARRSRDHSERNLSILNAKFEELCKGIRDY